MHKIARKIFKNRRLMLFTLALIVSFTAFLIIIIYNYNRLLISVIVSILLFLIGAVSGPLSIRIFGYYHVGFDLIPFVSINFFYTYDFAAGLLAAIGMNVLSCIATKQFSIGHIVEMVCYAIIGIISMFLHLTPFLNGMLLVIIWNILIYIIFYFMRISSPNEWIRISGNILLSFILFKYFGDFILKLIN